MNRICSWTLASITLALVFGGCHPEPAPSLALAGIWNADVRYATLNGEPYTFEGPQNFRFDPVEDGWSCLVGGLTADSCTFDGSAASFYVHATSIYTASSYTRVRTYEFSGTAETDDKTLEARFVSRLEYQYPDGTADTYDFTGSATLVRIEPHDEAQASGLTLLGEYGVFEEPAARVSIAHEEDPVVASHESGAAGLIATANVRVRGDYAFLARFSDGLRVLNVADPANIYEVAHAPVEAVGAQYYNDVKLFSTGGRDYAALSDSQIGLVVYDVTEPAQPTFVSSFFPGLKESGDRLNNHTCFIVGTMAYLGNYGGSATLDPEGGGESGGLLMVDLSDPANPREAGRWLASSLGGSFVHDLYVSEDGIAYLCCWEIGLVILDVRDPANAVVLGRFAYDRMTSHSVWVTTIGGRRVAINGDEDFGAHMRIIDVEEPSHPTLISEFQLRPEVSVHNIMAVGDQVVAAHYQDGVRVIDLHDPAHPVEAGYFNSWLGTGSPENGRSFYEGGIGVDVHDDLVYLADIERGLLVLHRD
jgi:hypothetical protein